MDRVSGRRGSRRGHARDPEAASRDSPTPRSRSSCSSPSFSSAWLWESGPGVARRDPRDRGVQLLLPPAALHVHGRGSRATSRRSSSSWSSGAPDRPALGAEPRAPAAGRSRARGSREHDPPLRGVSLGHDSGVAPRSRRRPAARRSPGASRSRSCSATSRAACRRPRRRRRRHGPPATSRSSPTGRATPRRFPRPPDGIDIYLPIPDRRAARGRARRASAFGRASGWRKAARCCSAWRSSASASCGSRGRRRRRGRASR